MQANNFIWCSTQATTFCSSKRGKLAVYDFLTDSIHTQNHVHSVLEIFFKCNFNSIYAFHTDFRKSQFQSGIWVSLIVTTMITEDTLFKEDSIERKKDLRVES